MVKSHQKKTTTPCQHRWHHPQRAGAPRRQARERNEDLHRACSCVDNEAREGVPGSRGKKRRPARRHAQHASPAKREERSGHRTRRATSRIWRSAGLGGRPEERARNGAASRPSAPSRCEAPQMGLAAADTKGRASRRGRAGEDEEHWSSGCVGLQRVEAAGRSERKTRGRAASGARYGARFAKKEARKENELD